MNRRKFIKGIAVIAASIPLISKTSTEKPIAPKYFGSFYDNIEGFKYDGVFEPQFNNVGEVVKITGSHGGYDGIYTVKANQVLEKFEFPNV